VKESPEIINIVYIYSEKCYGTVGNIGIYASEASYVKDGIEHVEVIDNEDFVIMNEIVLMHIEEEDE
jgi:hypothetical protein